MKSEDIGDVLIAFHNGLKPRTNEDYKAMLELQTVFGQLTRSLASMPATERDALIEDVWCGVRAAYLHARRSGALLAQ